MFSFLALSLTILPLGSLASTTSVKAARSLGLGAGSSNGTLPIYRNDSHCVDDRVEDLLSRMTIEEKAGQMFQAIMRIGPNYTLDPGSYDPDSPRLYNSTENMVGEKFMTHFNLGAEIDDPRRVAEWFNLLQRRALDTRLGIPITLSTDPRHSASGTEGASISAGGFSLWPESLGLAATRDTDLVRRFAEVAREEYVSVGIRASLHPQVDVVTEPRWARIFNSWSEDAHLTAELISAYIKGFQGEQIGPRSVTTVTKHFPGGGPMENGEDSHFVYGKNQTYPGNNMEYHLIPFKAAIKAGARQMMPYYSRPIGTDWEEVGFGFNRQIVTELLREELGFEGIVTTDWSLLTDVVTNGYDFPARAWGMEDESDVERAFRILEAGCDQFGGEERPEIVVELVRSGRISEERVDTSVRRILKEKFLLGLFDSPFVDPEAAERVVGNPYFVKLGEEAQRRSYTLLTNKEDILPLRNPGPGMKVYGEGFNTSHLTTRGLTVVETPQEADLAILRLSPPFDPRNDTLSTFLSFQAGTLEYSASEKQRQASIYAAVPTIVDIYFDRPVAVPEVAEQARALLANYGATDAAFLDIVFGDSEPEGRLPFDLLRSDEAAEEQMEDVPFDTRDPVFKFGHGLRYKGLCEGDKDKRCL